MNLRKLISLFVVVLMLSQLMVIGFGAAPTVERVVFKNLNSSLNHIGMGGIRFYNNSEMIDSGEVVTDEATSGETDNFTISVSSGYGGYYNVVNAIDTDKEQTGYYTD